MEILPISTLLNKQDGGAQIEARKALARADVILGVDTASQREFTVFGTPALEETVQVGKQQALGTLRVELDVEKGELDQLVALVRAIKGRGDAGPRV